MREVPCPDCGGARLKPLSLGVTIDGYAISDVSGMSIGEAAKVLEGLNLSEALLLAVSLLGADPAGGPSRELAPAQLEVAVLDRNRPRRTFRRITGQLLERLLSTDDPTHDAPAADEGAAGSTASVRDATTNPQTQRPTQAGAAE